MRSPPSRVPLDRGSAMALAAARDAARDAGLEPGRFDPERLGIFWGSGMAGAATFEATCRTVYADRRRMRPTSVVTTMPNAPVAELALRFGARGAALAYACACASSAVAIGEAMRAIRAGWIDVAIAGGSESMLTPGVLASWQAMRVLAPVSASASSSASVAACVPALSADRNGFALGEAAAAFVLESAAHASARGASRIASLAGYATNCDGVHITQPDAAGQARAMRAALADAGLAPGDIGYVNAHGTATLAGDAAEAESIARVFGAHGVPVSSTKAIHGHLLGAGGAVELLVAMRALRSRRSRRRRASAQPTRPSRSTSSTEPRGPASRCARRCRIHSLRRNERRAGRDARRLDVELIGCSPREQPIATQQPSSVPCLGPSLQGPWGKSSWDRPSAQSGVYSVVIPSKCSLSASASARVWWTTPSR